MIKVLLENRKVKFILCFSILMVCLFMLASPVHAVGNVSGVIQSAWQSAETQIKNVVNNVVFPVIDLILAVFFFVKLGMAYFDYRKQGQFEWTAPAILFACLCFTLTAPNYVWNII